LFDIKEIPINDIIIKDRVRSVLPDNKSLKESIETIGLLNAITIDDNLTLCAGARRLDACKDLNWLTIPARILPGIKPTDSLMIEFIENMEREDFTWIEELILKKKMHDLWKEQAMEKKEKWGFRETSAKLKISLGGLSTDLTLAAALPLFPELKKEATKNKAKEVYKKLQNHAAAIQSMDNLDVNEKNRLLDMMSGKIPDQIADKNTAEGGKQAGDGEQKNSVYPNHPQDEASSDGQISPSIDENLPKFNYEICSYEKLIVKIPDNTIGFCEIDWPYAIGFNETYGKTTNITTTETDWTFKELSTHAKKLLPILYNKMLNDSWVLCWTGKEYWTWLNEVAVDAGFSVQPFGIWRKPSGSSNTPTTNMISTFETFLLFRKGKATFNCASFDSVQECVTVPASQKTHQWEKPIKLYTTFFSAIGKPGSIFFSPFAGSGASMVTATLNDMTPIGCDIRDKYFFSFYKMLKNYHIKE